LQSALPLNFYLPILDQGKIAFAARFIRLTQEFLHRVSRFLLKMSYQIDTYNFIFVFFLNLKFEKQQILNDEINYDGHQVFLFSVDL
jgi:hypothetical protein